MKGDSELRNGLTMQPLVLNANSDATVETGTASTSLVTLDNTWYQLQFPSITPISQYSHPFHHHNFQQNTFQPHYCNLQIAQLARNVHITSEPSHMDH